MRPLVSTSWIVAAVLAVAWGNAPAAQRGAGASAAPQAPGAATASASAQAPIDLTGYWVSLVSDEWRYRMITPPRGNVDYVPITAEGRKLAEAWDPAKDEASHEECRGYGAGGIMRLPSRLHIAWSDPKTLRIDIDTGTQTRLLHFGGEAPQGFEPSWQGYSDARWQVAGGRGAPAAPGTGQLKVTTTHLRPGYLRKNGVPYSADAVLTEYFTRLIDDDGATYLAVTSFLEDPIYLNQPWVRTSQFRKQADGSGWNPTSCSAR